MPGSTTSPSAWGSRCRVCRSTTRGCCPRRSIRRRGLVRHVCLFINPTAHNPTTATMSERRREAIVAAARKHDLDHHRGRRLRPAAGTSPAAGRGAGARAHDLHQQRVQELRARAAAWDHRQPRRVPAADRRSPARPVPDLPAADGRTVPPLARHRHGRPAGQTAADRGGRPPGIGQGSAWARTTIAPSRPAIISGCRCRRPGGPLTFTAALRERGVAVDPSSAFAFDPANAPHAVRVSLSAAASRERLARALSVVAETLAAAPARRRDVI